MKFTKNQFKNRLSNLNLTLELHEEILFYIEEMSSDEEIEEMNVTLVDFEDESLMNSFYN